MKELLKKSNGNLPRTPEEIESMIADAAEAYANFLTAVGFDYTADRQTVDTPRRVAKAWLKDLIVGSVTEPTIRSLSHAFATRLGVSTVCLSAV